MESEIDAQQTGVVSSEVHATPTPAAVPSVGQSEASTGVGHPPGINGTDHHGDIAQRVTPSATGFSASPVTQPEPVVAAPQPVKAPSPPAETIS